MKKTTRRRMVEPFVSVSIRICDDLDLPEILTEWRGTPTLEQVERLRMATYELVKSAENIIDSAFALPEGWYPIRDERWRDAGRVLVSAGIAHPTNGGIAIVIAEHVRIPEGDGIYTAKEGWRCDGGGYYMGAKMWRYLPSL